MPGMDGSGHSSVSWMGGEWVRWGFRGLTMSTSPSSKENSAEAMHLRQATADRSLRYLPADKPCEMTFKVTPEFRAELEQLMCDTRQNLEVQYFPNERFRRIRS